jgi:hypothetical protein
MSPAERGISPNAIILPACLHRFDFAYPFYIDKLPVMEIRSIEESESLAVFDFQRETFPHTKK